MNSCESFAFFIFILQWVNVVVGGKEWMNCLAERKCHDVIFVATDINVRERLVGDHCNYHHQCEVIPLTVFVILCYY